MQLFLEAVNIVAILLILFMLAVVLKQQSSKVQTAFILYNLFTMVFIVGIHLELIHSDTVGEALSGLCVQYVGQAGLLMSLMWFVSEFAGLFIPMWVYRLEAVCNVCVLVGIFTAQNHRLFYTSMEILTDGMYHRIKVGHGILWYLHFAHLDAVAFTILILCCVRYRKSTHVQKKRILYIAAGIGILVTVLLLKRVGVFGSYNPIVIAMAFTMLCMVMAMVRYSYFNSLQAAVDNAFNHGNEGLIILDAQDTIIFVNHRMDKWFPGIHKGSEIGKYQEIRELLENDKNLLHKDGEVYELREEDIVEQGEKNGRMLWFVNQTQQLLTMQKLKEADEAKTQFLMRVSHELRTPMNTMLGMNEMILRESRDARIKSYAKEAAGAGVHMLSLIDEVLDASRLESGAITVMRAPYLIREVLEKAEELMRPQAEKKGLAFMIQTEDALMTQDVFQMGDASHILQVLVNLLSNAIKYTDSGFVLLKAETQTESEDMRLILSVSDSGIGIRKEELAQIFENFGRGSNADGRDGMGLGLAIVKQLVEAMGGTLTVESTLGKGSVFIVSLIWAEASEEELAKWKKEQEDEEAAEYEETKEFPDFHTKTILAVDDNDYNLKVLKHLLRRTKAVVETASNGQDALDACARRRYDLILLDHMMPGMDGIVTLHRIRGQSNGKNRETKVIALTANAQRGAEQMYLSEGFAGYIAKPVNPGKLEQLLMCCFDAGNQSKIPEAKKWSAEGRWLEILEENGIHTQEGMNYADGDLAFYRELLILFAEQQEKQRQKLDGIYEEIIGQQSMSAVEGERKEDETSKSDGIWNEWIVSCHGLKSEARGLGALTLGGYFYQLELAAKTRDREKIKECYPITKEEWEKVADGIHMAVKEPLAS